MQNSFTFEVVIFNCYFISGKSTLRICLDVEPNCILCSSIGVLALLSKTLKFLRYDLAFSLNSLRNV